jgi:hypothetical protein
VQRRRSRDTVLEYNTLGGMTSLVFELFSDLEAGRIDGPTIQFLKPATRHSSLVTAFHVLMRRRR